MRLEIEVEQHRIGDVRVHDEPSGRISRLVHLPPGREEPNVMAFTHDNECNAGSFPTDEAHFGESDWFEVMSMSGWFDYSRVRLRTVDCEDFFS